MKHFRGIQRQMKCYILVSNAVTFYFYFAVKDDTSDTPVVKNDIVKTAGITAGISAPFMAVIIVGIIYLRRRQNRELRRNDRHERYGTTCLGVA